MVLYWIHIALYVPDGTHLALPSHVVEAAVETLDKAAEPAVGVVLDGHRPEKEENIIWRVARPQYTPSESAPTMVMVPRGSSAVTAIR